MVTFILTIVIAMSISWLCSVLEACLLSLSLTDIANISEKKPLIADIWKRFKDNIEKPIAVILIVNTLSHTIGASLSGAQFNDLFGHKWIIVFSIGFSFVMIQWTELLPKTLGVKYNRAVAILTGVPLQWLVTLFTPLVALCRFLNRPFVRKNEVTSEMDALNDINVLARFATLNNLLSKDQADILTRTMNLSKMRVRDVMVERHEVKYLSTKMSLIDALVYAHIHHHTRLPLIEGDNLDQIIGYVNFKDIVSVLQINPANPSLQGICRPILMVSDDDSFSVMLNKLTKGYQHIAVVKSRQGSVAGIVTLEDAIESIIGEVSDEYDILPHHLYQITPSRYVAGGGISLHEVAAQFHIPCPDEAMLLSDWLKAQCGRIPKIEERLTCQGINFIVRKISRSNIHEVIIETEPVKEQ